MSDVLIAFLDSHTWDLIWLFLMICAGYIIGKVSVMIYVRGVNRGILEARAEMKYQMSNMVMNVDILHVGDKGSLELKLKSGPDNIKEDKK